MQVDIEIALMNAPADEIEIFQRDLPSEFYIEDQSENGWGLVIRTSSELPIDFSDAIAAFLGPLSLLVNLINSYEGILRAGVFYNTANCTIRLSSFDRLAAFGLELEISTYPENQE